MHFILIHFFFQLKLRLRKTVQHRQTYLKSKNADVSPEAQELYRVIAKQFKVCKMRYNFNFAFIDSNRSQVVYTYTQISVIILVSWLSYYGSVIIRVIRQQAIKVNTAFVFV